MKDKTQPVEKEIEIEIENKLKEMNYPATDDIYSKDKPVANIDVEKIATTDELNTKENLWNENAFDEEKLGADLDVPGSELDDEQENSGNEDEENNYYSQADTK